MGSYKRHHPSIVGLYTNGDDKSLKIFVVFKTEENLIVVLINLSLTEKQAVTNFLLLDPSKFDIV